MRNGILFLYCALLFMPLALPLWPSCRLSTVQRGPLCPSLRGRAMPLALRLWFIFELCLFLHECGAGDEMRRLDLPCSQPSRFSALPASFFPLALLLWLKCKLSLLVLICCTMDAKA